MKDLKRTDIIEMLPKGISHDITEEVVNLINGMEASTGISQDYMKESFLTHVPSLREVGSVSLRGYVNAIKYCNLKQNMTNKEAWKIVFPDRYQQLVQNGKEVSINANVSMYNRRKLITKIDANMMIAAYIQYQPFRHAAIQTQFNLMNGQASPTRFPRMKTDKRSGKKTPIKDSRGNVVYDDVYMKVSPVVQQLASAELIRLTDMPEDKEIGIKIGLSDEAIEAQNNFTNKLVELARAQQIAIENGIDIHKVQRIGDKIFDIEPEDE